jgi:selenocysteine-specific elongation factor
MTSDRFDAFVEVRPSAARGIQSHQRVRAHLGTAERLGTLIVLGADKVGPRESAYCQLTISEPLLTMRGDHFVIRDETARRTIGGGIVIDPWAARHRKSDRGLMERLDVLRRGELRDVLQVFLDESSAFAMPLGPIHQFANLTEGVVQAELQLMDGVRVFALEGETLYSTERKWTGLTRALCKTLEQFHAAHPLAPGMEMEATRDTLPGSISPRLFRAVIGQLETEKRVAREGSLLRLPSHSVRLKDDERGLADRIAGLLARTPLAPPDLKQLQAGSGVARDKLEEVLRVMERTQSVVRVSPELYFLRSAVDDAKAMLRQHLSESSDVTPAIVRDLFGTSRKYAVPLLEFLDREGVTMKVGTGRRLRR